MHKNAAAPIERAPHIMKYAPSKRFRVIIAHHSGNAKSPTGTPNNLE